MQVTAIVMAAALLLAGCAMNPVANRDMVLRRESRSHDYTFANWLSAREKAGRLPETLVFLSFSGGGARAAATALGVLELLENNEKLAGSIALISSTSGGSVTAATYAVQGKPGLTNLNDNFLRKQNMGELTARLLPRMFLPGVNRGTEFAAYLDEKLFPGSPPTYDRLRDRWPAAPFVVLNATDMGSGRNFEFTQESFSEICSDLGPFPLTHAVAASASFPFLLNPVPLRNHWADGFPDCPKNRLGRPAAEELAEAGNDQLKFKSPERLARAQYAYALEHSYEDQPKAAGEPDRNIKYIHLLDGGLSDNLAARAVMRILSGHLQHLQERGVANLVIIQVNAKSLSSHDYDTSAAIPGWVDVFWSVTLNPIDIATELSSYSSRLYTAELARTIEPPKKDGRKINVLTMPVDFTLLDRQRRLRAQTIKTDWSLGDDVSAPDALTFLKQAARELLEQNPCYRVLQDPGSATCHYVKVAEAPEALPGPHVAPVREPIVATAPPALEKRAPQPAPAPPAPAAAAKVTYSADAFFDSGRWSLKPEGRSKLDDLVARIRGVELEVVIAIGHTDSVGSEAYNQRLSARRAEAVKDYLVLKGVEKRLIYTEGKGAKQPVASNGTAQGRAKNRRVEIEVVGRRAR